MYLADYHMHSKYSFDGSEELDTICQTAIRRGLSEIAIESADWSGAWTASG